MTTATSLGATTGYRDLDVPRLRRLETSDLSWALRRGWEDFLAMPTHVIFISLFYPIIGVILAGLTFGYDLLPMLFPLASGFALVGPFAAIGLYELSRRRESGEPTGIAEAIGAYHGPAMGSLLALGVVLLIVLAAWLFVANAIYVAIFGAEPSGTLSSFLKTILTTPRGWALIVVGNAVGFAFSLVTLALTAVSFPMILDRHVGVGTAVRTSVRLIQENPVTMVTWGLIVAALLVAGSIPVFVGLAVVLPLLGHATWHLYRRAVEA